MKSNPSLLQQHLEYLKLPFVKTITPNWPSKPPNTNGTMSNTCAGSSKGEYHERRQRVIERRIKAARFPVLKTLEQFHWDWPKKINRLQVQNLFRLEFLTDKANVVLLGTVGLGKTHLATALGYAACQEGASVLFANAISVINDLTAAQKRGLLKRQLKNLSAARTAGLGRNRLSAHRPARRRSALPGHQPALRTRLHRPDHQQALQAVALDLQQRQHHRLRRSGPPPPPRRNHRHRRLQLPDERPGKPMKQRFENSGASHRHDRIFKPAVLRHFRAAAHSVSQAAGKVA